MVQTFSYLNDTTKTFEFSNQPFDVVMTKISSDIAELHFIDSNPENNETEIEIPDGITFVDLAHNHSIKSLNNRYFFLVWFANYSLQLNGTEILRFINQKQQEIIPIARKVMQSV
jgi:hypothetical protein